VDTYINWVPGHCALEWNEVADMRANAARRGEGLDAAMQADIQGGLRMPTPYPVAQRRMRDAIRQVWHERWVRAESATNRRMQINPIAHVPAPRQWCSQGNGTGRGTDFVGRRMATTIDRVRLGAATTNEFLTHVDPSAVQSGRCDRCDVVVLPAPDETPEQRRHRRLRTGERDSIDHRVDHCPCVEYTATRLTMRNTLRGIQGLRDDASLPELLGMTGVTQGDRVVVANAVRNMFEASGLDAVVMRRRDEVRVDGGGDGQLAD
jgi:hypothetical protein